MDADGPEEPPIPLLNRIVYALPSFSTTSLTLFISLYANDFYVSLGTGLSFLSFFTALARSFDVITDPLMGWFTDTTDPETTTLGFTGRRRPYMAWGPVFFGTALTLLFYPPPFYPNTPDEVKEYNPIDASSDFFYGHNVDGRDRVEDSTNNIAGYWFGIFYVLFYLLDTFTNVPYEAFGPEIHSSSSERAKLFFMQKLVNMLGMLTAAAMPAVLQIGIRGSGHSLVEVECGYLYHEDSNETHLLHGTKPNQLLFTDYDPGGGRVVNKTAEFCMSGQGAFCYEVLYENGTHFWFEQNVREIEMTCDPDLGGMNSTALRMNRYTMSSLSASQFSFVATAALFGMYHLCAMLLLVTYMRYRMPEKGRQQVSLPLITSVVRSFTNPAFKPLLAAWALDGLTLAALVTMFPFYIRYVVIPDGLEAQKKNQELSAEVVMAVFVLVLLVSAMLASLLWLWLSQWRGKFWAWQAFNFLSFFTNLSFFFIREGDSYWTIATAIANGIPLGGQFLVNTVMSDVIDYDEFLNGVRSEGSFSVFATLIPKFVSIPASAIPLALINMLGFKQPVFGVAQPQNPVVSTFIEVCFVMLPATCQALSFFIKFRYPIKKDEDARTIQQGTKKFQRGVVQVWDPILKKHVHQRKFTPQEETQAVMFEMFPVGMLRRYRMLLEEMQSIMSLPLEERRREVEPVKLAKLVAPRVMFYGAVTSLGLGGTIGTFPLLQNQKASIIPVMCCIFFGFSVCLLGMSFLQWINARELQQYQFDTSMAFKEEAEGGSDPHAFKLHLDVLAKVIALKERLERDKAAQVINTHQVMARIFPWASAQLTDRSHDLPDT